MTTNAPKLIKRYQYDQRKKRYDDKEEGTWEREEDVTALDAYGYKGATYLLAIGWHYSGSGDTSDSDHNWNLEITVYPLEAETVENEEAARALMASAEGYRHATTQNLPLTIRSEEEFTSGLRSHVMGAIDAYLAEEKKKQAENTAKAPQPNAVRVHETYAPTAETVYDFDSHAGLGALFYQCTKVRIQPLDEESQAALGIDRPLCYYSPEGLGRPTVFAYCYPSGNPRVLRFRKNSKFDYGVSAILCGYDKGTPSPLTPDEVARILAFVQ